MEQNTIFLFPGQGSQYVGMSSDIFRDFAAARYVFEEVSDCAHQDVLNIATNGPADKLNRPKCTSLATFAHSLSIARVIESEFGMPLWRMSYAMAGHSMGEYSALCCAGCIDLQTAVSLLSARAHYMEEEARPDSGMMCVVGLGRDVVESMVRDSQIHGYAAISNHNARDQFVVSGEAPALDVIISAAQRHGARIAKRLNVSVPAHCAMMKRAAMRMREHMLQSRFSAPKTKLFSNETADLISNPDEIRDAIGAQLINGVRWCEIMEKFPAHNITRAYELGPGRTLTGLVNRARVGCVAARTDTSDNVRKMLYELRLSAINSGISR